MAGKARVKLISLTRAQYQASQLVMAVNQQAHAYQDPGTSSPKWNTIIFNVISYTCVFPAMTGQNDCSEKGIWHLSENKSNYSN